jgi:hypothetical protein
MGHHHPGPLHRLEHLLEQLVREIHELTHRHHHGTTTIHVVAVSLREDPPVAPTPIDHMPDLQLPSSTVHAVLAVVGPQLASSTDASPVYATSPIWTTNNPEALPVEVLPDSVVTDEAGEPVLDAAGNQIPVFKAKALTPLDEGSGTVKWSANGMADVDIKVTYSDPPVGHAAITPSIESD